LSLQNGKKIVKLKKKFAQYFFVFLEKLFFFAKKGEKGSARE
jgi:hypothetical protein